MYAQVYGETTCGINGEQIIVEVVFLMVCPALYSRAAGYGSEGVAGTVRAALKNSGLVFPMTRITVTWLRPI